PIFLNEFNILRALGLFQFKCRNERLHASDVLDSTSRQSCQTVRKRFRQRVAIGSQIWRTQTRDELGRLLQPVLDRVGHKARRQMCPLYVSGLIGPGDRKSVQPMAKRLALGACDQLHHFIAAGVWDATPVETELLVQADRLVGGSDAVLVIDDTAIPKKGT